MFLNREICGETVQSESSVVALFKPLINSINTRTAELHFSVRAGCDDKIYNTSTNPSRVDKDKDLIFLFQSHEL